MVLWKFLFINTDFKKEIDKVDLKSECFLLIINITLNKNNNTENTAGIKPGLSQIVLGIGILIETKKQ